MAKKGGGASVPGYERQNTEDYEELPLKIPVRKIVLLSCNIPYQCTPKQMF